MVSVIIPTLFPALSLGAYVSKLVGYKSVEEVIVVVNGKDETPSLRRVGGELPQGSTSFPGKGVVWHFLGKNTGFTGACNAGAKAAVGEFSF